MPDAEYDEILEFGRRMSRQEGIDKVMKEHDVNIIVAPSDSPLYVMAALAGSYSRVLFIVNHWF